jgi:hypothetical protein
MVEVGQDIIDMFDADHSGQRDSPPDTSNAGTRIAAAAGVTFRSAGIAVKSDAEPDGRRGGENDDPSRRMGA